METKIKHFIKLLKEKKELAKSTKDNQEFIDGLEPEIRLHFGDNGIEKLTQDGLTLFIRRQLFAQKCEIDDQPISNEVCLKALQDAGMENFFEEKIKMQALSAFFKELEDDDQPLPEALQGKFKAREVFKITGRRV